MEAKELWIIGIGNRQRGDDGIGPYVADRLGEIFFSRRDVHVDANELLDPVLLEDLKDAARVVFVDAAAGRQPAAWTWTLLEPYDDERDRPLHLHDLQAKEFLCLLDSCYGRRPEAWMVAVQGEDFEFGEGLSREARRRAGRVIEEIAALAG